MFSDLPKLFDRNFAIGYVLPASFYIFISLASFQSFGIIDISKISFNVDPILGSALIVLIPWLCGILLVALNWEIIRFLEGYGYLNPLNLLLFIQKQGFQINQSKIQELLKKASTQGLSTNDTILYNSLSLEFAEKFPYSQEHLLPTTFGNTLRAFEVYPNFMYGIEAIQGWNRLQIIISKDYQQLIDDAKAQMDMWVNFWILSLLFFAIFLTLTILTQNIVGWTTVIAFTMPWILSRRATSSAIGWGEMVKSAFDVYLPELRDKLGYKDYMSTEEEFEFWRKYSQAIIYRSPETFPQRHPFKPQNNEKADDGEQT